MPSVSKKQHNFMTAIAHSPEFAQETGVPMSVGKEFTVADALAAAPSKGGKAKTKSKGTKGKKGKGGKC
jgi:hypothetical protein